MEHPDSTPQTCPVCGCVPTQQSIRESASTGVVQADYICAFDHPWIVRWLAVA